MLVNQLSGDFDPSKVTRVELHSVSYGSINNNLFTGVSRSTSDIIGYANIKGLSLYNTSYYAPNTTPTYGLYLFNIQMNPGYNFGNVKGVIVYNGTSVVGVADAVLSNNTALLYSTSDQTLLSALGPKAVQALNNTQFTYRAKSNTTTFTTSGVLTVSTTDTIPYSGTLNATQVLNFVVFPNANLVTANKSGTVSNSNSTVLVGSGTSFLTDYVIGDYIYIGGSVPGRVYSIANNTYMQVQSPLGAGVTANTHAKLYPTGVPIAIANHPTQTITVTSGNTVTINLNDTFTSNSITGTVYFDAVRVHAAPIQKNINYNSIVTINCSNNAGGTTGPWCLGLPDVLDIKGVYIGTNNTFATTGVNYVNNFLLDSGQQDSFYGLAQLKINPSSPPALSNTSTITVVLDNFTINTSTGKGYFTVGSYPIDDANTANTTAIQTAEIPIYKSSQGVLYDLRDTVDFRPVVVNTAIVTSNVASATVNPNSAISFSNTNNYLVSPSSIFQTDLTYYLGRTDLLAMSPRAVLTVKEGYPGVYAAPTDVPGAMTLATITIPPYPSLATDEAAEYNRYDYIVSTKLQQNRRYTMKDIGGLDSRIKNLEYYTSLSFLESTANSTTLISNTTGNSRFMNGFLVDPFNNFAISDTLDQTFNIAIDSVKSLARPAFNINAYDLKFNSSNSVNANQYGSLTTLQYSNAVYINQPFASQYRNCTQETLYTWTGTLILSPDADTAVDYTKAPTVVATIDDASNWINLVNSWGTQWGTWNTTSVANSSSTAGSTTTTTTTTTQARTGLQVQASVSSSNLNLGSYITSIGVSPYVRPNAITFTAYGMKPNTVVYPYFDDTVVSQYCANASGTIGGTLTTDANGYVQGVFHIPSNTFNTGNLTFKLVDVANLTTGSNDITSQASTTYIASSVNATTANVVVQSRTATISTSTVSDTRVITSTSKTTSTTPVSSTTGATPAAVAASTNTAINAYKSAYAYLMSLQGFQPSGGHADPIGQSFTVNTPSGTGAEGIFINAVDIFFQSKDPILGVELQVRTMDNGYPTPTIVPFGRVYLPSASVNTSSDASVATKFVFSSPIYLQAGQQYFLCVIPAGGNPNYTVWTGVIGGTDVTTGAPIYTIDNSGDLFVSSTNLTWSPYQNEDMKYTLYRADFASNGIFEFVNKDIEFITFNSKFGTFLAGETIYCGNSINNNAVLAITSANAAFTNGMTVWQSNGTANIALGTITFANTSVLKVANITGSFIASGNAQTSNAQAVISSVSQNVSFSNNSTLITVPDASVYTVGANVYITSNTGLITQFNQVVTSNSVTNQITVSTNTLFGDTNAKIGFIRNGLTSNYVQISNNVLITTNSNANGTINYTNILGLPLFGSISGAQVFGNNVINIPYDTVNFQLQATQPVGTSVTAGFIGVNNTYTQDTTYTPISLLSDYNLLDQERILLSKTNEAVNLANKKSLVIQLQAFTSNSFVTPTIDNSKQQAILISNQITPSYKHHGKLLHIANATGIFTNNETVTLVGNGSVTGVVALANNNTLYLANASGTFNIGNTVTGTQNATITSVQDYGETIGVTIPTGSRYISNKVTLAADQDAEDMVVYVSGYRPQSTDIEVYCKLINSADPVSYYNGIWSKMVIDSTTANAYSSLANTVDLVDLKYNLPVSQTFVITGVSTTNNSNVVSFTSVTDSNLQVGKFVYLKNNTTNEFNITSITNVINSTAVSVNDSLSFTSSNVEFGYINNLQIKNAAFKYSNNSGIVRYVSNNVVYDTFLTFAIKIVPVSSVPNIVPEFTDMRALALQV
jgi:hypothetical protein